MSDIVEAARGKWQGILPLFGVDGVFLRKKHGPCPMCGGKDRFIFDDKEGRGTYHCNQCGAGTGLQLISHIKGWQMNQVVKEVGKVVGEVEYKQPDAGQSDQQKKEALNKAWAGAQAIRSGDPAQTYLSKRTGCLWASNALRYHAELWHPDEKKTYPAMIAKVTDIDNKPVSIHRTFLDADGTKARISKAKMVMSSTIPDGSAIRLMPHDHILGIAEGIETALSASVLFGVPVWAAISAAVMSKWKAPISVEKVIIFGDNDPNFVGQTTAYKLAFNLRKEYGNALDITVAIPSIRGADWNDFVTILGMEEAAKQAVNICPTAFRALPKE